MIYSLYQKHSKCFNITFTIYKLHVLPDIDPTLSDLKSNTCHTTIVIKWIKWRSNTFRLVCI